MAAVAVRAVSVVVAGLLVVMVILVNWEWQFLEAFCTTEVCWEEVSLYH